MDSSNNDKQTEPNSKQRLFIKGNRIFGKLRLSRSGFSKDGQKQTELDKKLVYSLAKSRIPNLTQLKYIKRFLSPRERWILRVSFTVLFLSAAVLAADFYTTNLKEVPITGGTYVEGLIGSPKYINPLYASVSDVDRDLSSLVYSSLFKRDANGKLKNDLAVSYDVSEDGKTYTIKIKDNAHWHDGSPLTVDDILYTFSLITDSDYKSPLRNSFQGVTAKKSDEGTIQFTLSEPYAAFLELLTFGILPREIWYQIPPETASLAELNLKPIGSGPYEFKSLVKDKNGSIREYHLVYNSDYYNKPPYIENLTFKFYPNFEEALAALNSQQIEGISYLPSNMKDSLTSTYSLDTHELNLPQLTAIFFNQKNNPALAAKEVRQALAYAINKNGIIDNILKGEARAVDSPILPDSFAYDQDVKKYQYDPEQAAALLEQAGWKNFTITEEETAKSQGLLEDRNEAVRNMAETVTTLGPGIWRRKDDQFLMISLTTVAREDNAAIIDAVKSDWEKVGVKTITATVEPSLIQSQVIKPRDFQALFYGLIVGADPDMYPLWHSSQIDSGLNIANYANNEVDQLLEEARTSTDNDTRREKYVNFQEIITEDEPAIFLYSPTYTYVQTKKVKGFDVNTILVPNDRFANITDWYVETGKKLEW